MFLISKHNGFCLANYLAGFSQSIKFKNFLVYIIGLDKYYLMLNFSAYYG